jgi:hypothetical protein
MIMKTLSLVKHAGIVALASAAMLMTPAVSFAGTPFIIGGPGYQPPVHFAAPVSGYHAFAAAEMGNIMAPHRSGEAACMRAPFSDRYAPCY